MSNPYLVVKQFEEALAEFCGSKYAVTVNSCSMALFLCCKYVDITKYDEIEVPKFTYPSVPASIVHAGGRIKFVDKNWQDQMWYRLNPSVIYDSAKIMVRGMYEQGSLMCLSFHAKKIINIGHGGAILTNDSEAYEWFKCARFDGRHEENLINDKLAFAGWNCYMGSYDAARGLELMQWLKDENYCEADPYQDLSVYDFFTKANR